MAVRYGELYLVHRLGGVSGRPPTNETHPISHPDCLTWEKQLNRRLSEWRYREQNSNYQQSKIVK